MTLKNTLILIVVVVVLGGGIWLLEKTYGPETESPEVEELEETGDAVDVFLKNLKQGTAIDFSDAQAVEFEWNQEEEEEIKGRIVNGKGIGVTAVSSEEQEKVTSFFIAQGFAIDLYNVADATVAGAVGYKSDQVVCSVVAGATGFKEAVGQWIPPEPDKIDIDVRCAKAEELVSQEPAQPETPEAEAIEAKKGGEFSVILGANPTTGFQWQEEFNVEYLELVEKTYNPVSPPPGEEPLVGAGGNQIFNFLALKPGETEITFSYLREWEEDTPPIEQKVYQVTIAE